MSYTIEPKEIIPFLDDTTIRLPRFQRRDTWDDSQKFLLCVSIFQRYPIGVVIVNKEKKATWLLDGRQRRTTLIKMRSNPIEIYDWAFTSLGMKKNWAEGEISEKYWGEIEKFLASDPDNSDPKEENFYEGEEENVEYSLTREEQREGLELLLRLILMIHKKTSAGSRWQRAFSFSQYCYNIPYQLKKHDNYVDPVELRKFLLDLGSKINEESLTVESFVEYYDDKCGILDDKSKANFIRKVQQNWTYISGSIKTILESEQLFGESKVGYIQLNNVTPMDAQIIFSRVNGSGTKLRAEELLSAKPFWNEPVFNQDDSVKKLVNDVYTKLGVETTGGIVRWDLASTLLARIDEKQLIFAHDDSDKLQMDQISLGFKIISSWFRGGMSSVSVNSLEKEGEGFTTINWDTDISDLADDINKVCSILLNDEFFKYFQQWGKPIIKLIGNAASLEFITIMLKDYIDKDRPTTSGRKYKAFQRDARILFDKLIFEYVTHAWKGSGDSKMMADIKDYTSRIKNPVEITDWTTFIEGAINGIYNGKETNQKQLTPILYYFYSIKHIGPGTNSDLKFDVDHIYPQELFDDNQFAIDKNKDCLANLALLPKKDNIKKGSRSLKEINEDWLIDAINQYAEISKKDFEKYSDLNNFDDLKKTRGKSFIKCFGEKRKQVLAN